MQTMVLVATDEGLGTCWIGSFNEGDVKALLGIPPSYAVVALLAIGYPHDKPSLTGTVRSMLLRRRGMESIASYEIFGNGYKSDAPQIGEA